MAKSSIQLIVALPLSINIYLSGGVLLSFPLINHIFTVPQQLQVTLYYSFYRAVYSKCSSGLKISQAINESVKMCLTLGLLFYRSQKEKERAQNQAQQAQQIQQQQQQQQVNAPLPEGVQYKQPSPVPMAQATPVQ